LGSRVARWHDFRVQYGNSGAFVGGVMDYQAVVKDDALSDVLLNAGEFNNSSVQLDTGSGGSNDKGFWWAPGTVNQFGLLQELEKLFNTDQSPVTIEVNPAYDGVDGGQMSLDDYSEMQSEGNEPPYDADNFGEPWQLVDTLELAGGQGKRETRWFNAPCGLLLIKGASANRLTLCVASGDYKGVMAPSMGTAKLTNEKKYIVR
jgi:hypothetical protein